MSSSHKRYIVIPTAGKGEPFQTNMVTREEMVYAEFVIDVNERKMKKNRRGTNGPVPLRTGAGVGPIAEPPPIPETYDPTSTTHVTMKPKRRLTTMLRKLAPWNF